jgi:hypothetical protein
LKGLNITYLIIDDFAAGLDTRKSGLTAPSGSLQRLNDLVITPGGEIAKRKAFVKVATLTNTFGLAATESTLYCFTRNVTVTPPSSGVSGVGLAYQSISSTDPAVQQTDFDTFDGNIYLATWNSGTGENKHFYNGVETQGDGHGYYIRTYATKIYGVLGKNLYYSAVNDPTNWTTGTGAGFTNLAKQDADAESLVSLEIYYDKMVVFSSEAAQIWSVDPDPNQNVLDQILRGAGAVSPLGAHQYGSGDVLYLSQTGVRSLRARDASNAAAVSDIGSPIDLDIQALYITNPGYFQAAKAIIEPIVGRFWMCFPNQIYVLSYFPGPHITAWSRYTVPFNIDQVTPCGGHVFIRSGDDLYVYGGADGNTYDGTVGEARLPYLDMKKPGHNKIFEALDMTVTGNWTVYNSFDYNQPDQQELIGSFSAPTWRDGRAEFTGDSSHFSLRFFTSGTGPATLSNCAVHYKMADEEA